MKNLYSSFLKKTFSLRFYLFEIQYFFFFEKISKERKKISFLDSISIRD
jgi:hypothetical protein